MESIVKQLQTNKVKIRVAGYKTVIGTIEDQNSVGIFFTEKFTKELTFYPFTNIIKIDVEATENNSAE